MAASTVRRVKRLGKTRGSSKGKSTVNGPNPCWSCGPQLAIKEVDGNGDKVTTGGSCMLTPPPYRMPPQPLYSEPASIPGSTTPSIQQMHTHSNKFPIEREVILSNYDKNSKIPILNEYHRKHKSSTVVPDAPNVQIAWSEDRTNRTYCDLRNTVGTPNINVEFHRTYKAQPLSLLDSTTGTEPSPIVAQEDSNGFACNYVKSNSGGRSHSTPETDPATKAFPSRTYHTIKDMISSRFGGKGKIDQVEVSLNNSENHHNETAVKTTTASIPVTSSTSVTATPVIYAKADNTLSPHSQLVQRGVYLTSGSQQRNAPVEATRTLDVMSYRENTPAETPATIPYRERGVDIGQTAGVNQQVTDVNNKVRSYESNSPAVVTATTSPSNKPAVPARPPPIEITHDTPNRYRGQDRNLAIQNAKFEASRNMKRFQNSGDGVTRLNEMCDTFSAANSQMYARQQISAHCSQRTYDHCPERTIVPANYHHNHQHGQLPSTSTDNTIHGGDEHRRSGRRLPNDAPYNGATNAISRARSNDHLLDSVSGKSHYNRKDLPLKHKSKSFESLGNDNNDEIGKTELPKSNAPLNSLNSDYEKHRCGGHSDSGRGSTVYSSGKLKHTTDTSPDSSEPHRITANKENQWADIVENELKHILEPKSNASIANSTLSDSSTSPPLPPVSPDGSSDEMAHSYKHKGLSYGSKIETPYRTSAPSSHTRNVWSRINAKEKMNQRLAVTMKKPENSSKISSTVPSSSVDLDSMLDEENNTSDEDMSVSDTRAIRKQLEGLENMYSEVMKLLGVKKSALNNSRYPTTDPRMNRRRIYGSVSSLPSSVSSRPIRDRHRRPEDRKKFVRDIKGINKRFQRLESHVVTLARSVAHLSSEMRTQHLMIQEMEVIRGELTNLRTQTNMLTVRSQSLPRYHSQTINEHVNSSPEKMKKLTKFFGDEPPLLRLFLKKLGYEKYAAIFEKERIGLVELPYMTEERLQKLGIPMGPRLRIIQEAQLGFPGTHENTLCIV